MILDLVLGVLMVLIIFLQYRRGALMALRGLLTAAGAGYFTYRSQSAVTAYVWQHQVRSRLIDKVKQQFLTGRALDPNYTYREIADRALAKSGRGKTAAAYVVDHGLRQTVYPVVTLIVTAVLFVLSALILFLLLRIVIGFFRRSGPVRGVDSILGAVFGLLEGLILLAVLGAVIAAARKADLGAGSAFAAQADASRIVKFVQEFLFPHLNRWNLAL